MKTNDIVNLSRRRFVAGGILSVAGLTLGILPDVQAEQPGSASESMGTAPAIAGEFSPNAFLRIDKSGVVTVISKHLEMGQGTYTGLATLVAEELDADWDRVRVEGAPADASRYNNLFWGAMQGTGGSTAIANSFKQLREAGATARTMLIKAAAQQWNISESEITVSNGIVQHEKSGRHASFGELAELAGK